MSTSKHLSSDKDIQSFHEIANSERAIRKDTEQSRPLFILAREKRKSLFQELQETKREVLRKYEWRRRILDFLAEFKVLPLDDQIIKFVKASVLVEEQGEAFELVKTIYPKFQGADV
jgi:ferritin